MAKIKLKTVERRTTVSREAIRGAFAIAMGNKDKNTPRVPKSPSTRQTNIKKKFL